MQKVKKHTGIRIFFLALFLGYFADITFFTHSHITHGVTIVHSHFSCPLPTNKDSRSSRHDHSANALILIAHAQMWHSLVQTSPEIPDLPCTRHITYYTETAVIPEPISIPHFSPQRPSCKNVIISTALCRRVSNCLPKTETLSLPITNPQKRSFPGYTLYTYR